MKPTIRHGRRAALLIAMLLLTVGPVAAQTSKWWNSDQYRRQLGLTQEQSRRLEEIFQRALPGLKTQKQTLDTAEADFERLVERGEDQEVMNQVNRVETARAELNKSRTLMLLRMRQVLTTSQWVKLGALHQAAEKKADGTPSDRK